MQSFIGLNDLQLVAIGQRELDLATQAYAEFGKGRHAAALNMGDCFAYACAKANRAKLLFKGDDFEKTDARIYRQAVRALPGKIDGQAPLPVPETCPVTLDELLADAE